MPEPSPALRRRTVVVGGAALGAGLVIAGCTTPAPSRGGAAAGPGEVGGAPAGTALGPVSEVPVGSAKIYADQEVVVTQATAGTFAAFSTTCPHQGCAVAKVEGESIVCPCHGSTFTLDGSVVAGPARTGLTIRTVTVSGGELTLS